jgi:hypothetical protein
MHSVGNLKSKQFIKSFKIFNSSAMQSLSIFEHWEDLRFEFQILEGSQFYLEKF